VTATLALMRKEWTVLFASPVAYFVLMVNMNMVVERNLAPAIPVAAALAGVGLGALAERLRHTFPSGRSAGHILTAAILAVALLGPALRLVPQVVGLARDSTREHAARWMVRNLPQGARVLRESYTPRLSPEHFFLRKARFAARVPTEEIEAENYGYVLLAANAYGRFLREELRTERHHDVMAERYREMFDRYREVRTFEPGRRRQGPHLVLLEVVPE